MKKVKLALLIFSLALMMLSFLHGYAENMPFLFKFFAPNYYKNAQLLDKVVNQGKVIKKGDVDFDAFLKLCLMGKAAEFSDTMITEFYRGGSGMLMGDNGTINGMRIIIKYNNGNQAHLIDAPLRSYLKELCKKELFGWAIIFFVVGLVLNIAAFIIDKPPAL